MFSIIQTNYHKDDYKFNILEETHNPEGMKVVREFRNQYCEANKYKTWWVVLIDEE